MCVIVPNFLLIDETIAEMWPFFDFSRWWLSAVLNLKSWKF